YGLGRRYPARPDLPATPELKPAYDVAIIGGGKTGRKITVIRSNTITPESVRFGLRQVCGKV
ncbi:MAG: hypothetical protein ACE5JZ_01815, partial [Kiloniellales bacterium]